MSRLYIIIIDSVKRAFVITGGVGVLAAKLSPSLNSCTSQGAIPLRFAIRIQIRCVKIGRGIVTDEKQYQGKNLQEHGRGSVIVPDERVFFVLAESTGIDAHFATGFGLLRPPTYIRICTAIRFLRCSASSHLHQALVIHQSPLFTATTAF